MPLSSIIGGIIKGYIGDYMGSFGDSGKKPETTIISGLGSR